MKRLNSDFSINLYGVQCRLVTTNDAEFILNLRTDPILGKYIHDTDPSIDKQIEWIENYKQRELSGLEYYFIFSIDNVDYGVYRIYNIKDKTFTTGSWVFSRNSPSHIAIASVLIIRTIAFQILHFESEIDYDGIHVENISVWQFHKKFGMTEFRRIEDVKGTYICFRLEKEDFIKNMTKIERFLGY